MLLPYSRLQRLSWVAKIIAGIIMRALKFVYFYGIVMTNTDVLGRQNRDILVSCKNSSQKYIALKTRGGKPDFNRIWNSSAHLKKNPQYQISHKSVCWEVR